MQYIAAMTFDQAGRITKYAGFDDYFAAIGHRNHFEAAYPGMLVAENPGGNWETWRVADGELIDDPDPVVVSVDQVRVEAQRRLALGFDYDFADARGVHRIGTTERDMAGWDVVSKIAMAAIHLGMPDLVIQISTDTGMADVTAMEWQTVLLAAAAAQQPIWQASFAVQAMDPIPADYADDTYW